MDCVAVANSVRESPSKIRVLKLGSRSPTQLWTSFIPKCIFLGRGT